MNIRSTRKLGLLLALSLVAVSAMAAHQESAEFRRGYEEGYRDAMNGEKPQYGRYERGRIRIKSAIYGAQGRSGQTCNAKPALQRAIEDHRNGSRRSLSVMANNQLCGDPSPERVKSLVVTYQCGDSELNRVHAAQGKKLTIRCE